MGKNNYQAIEVGTRFSKWTTLEKVSTATTDKYKRQQFLCRCECGTEKLVDAYNLTNNKSSGCIHCFNQDRVESKNTSWRGYEEIPSSWFSRFKRYAKSDFDITMEYVWNQYIKQNKKCALSGMPISFQNDHPSGQKYIGRSCTASIDRIDSNKGYTVDNIQLVHKDVNIMKNAFNQEYYIKICKAVTEKNS